MRVCRVLNITLVKDITIALAICIISQLLKMCKTYLLFIGINKLYTELYFLSQLFKSPRPVLVLSVPILNGLTQRLEQQNYTQILTHFNLNFHLLTSVEPRQLIQLPLL